MLTEQEHEFLKDYQEQAVEILHMVFPQLTTMELTYAVADMISTRLKNPNITIDNSYKKQEVQTTLLELVDYVKRRGIIMTNRGVMFSKHGKEPNPISKMLDGFLSNRDAMKKKMFSYPKGTNEYSKYQLLQLLLKIDANGYYGCSGQYSAIYYNLYAASSVTTQGRQGNATAALFFEAFLANNVPFESLEELMVFINNVRKDKREFDDRILGLRNISLDECFFKLLYNCGFDWIPNYDEMEIVWNVLAQFSQEDLNRLYYKNNLYEFVENPGIMKLVLDMLCKLDEPFLNPNKPPEIIKEDIDYFRDLLHEYVFYAHQMTSKIEKMDALIRDVSIIQDKFVSQYEAIHICKPFELLES